MPHKKKRLHFWNIPVTEFLDKSVEKAVHLDAHVSKSDFIRDAVREKLQRMGFIENACAESTAHAQNTNGGQKQ
jgi:Arc/MetJ-type ribon-helix-helix transcriptional regulator